MVCVWVCMCVCGGVREGETERMTYNDPQKLTCIKERERIEELLQ